MRLHDYTPSPSSSRSVEWVKEYLASPVVAAVLQNKHTNDRIKLWNVNTKKTIAGSSAPILANLPKHLQHKPYYEVYVGQTVGASDNYDENNKGAISSCNGVEEATAASAAAATQDESSASFSKGGVQMGLQPQSQSQHQAEHILVAEDEVGMKVKVKISSGSKAPAESAEEVSVDAGPMDTSG